MSTSNALNVTNLNDVVDVAEQVRADIALRAAGATIDEEKLRDEILAKSRIGSPATEILTLPPAVSATLFLKHNPHNRDWRPELCREYERRMTTGQWQFNNASIGFYEDGALEDGQHRLGAAALAGFTLKVVVVYGVQRLAIVTVDDGKVRHASDAAGLDGIQNPKKKETVIKTAASYLVKAGDKAAALKSASDTKTAMKANNTLLDLAIVIGDGSSQNIADPVLKPVPSYILAYLMLTSGWSEQRIREKLALFQTGVSAEGEKTPYFVAAEVIKDARKRAQVKDRLSTMKELGVAVYAMVAAERGTKAVTHGTLKSAVKKDLPNPGYPAELATAAA